VKLFNLIILALTLLFSQMGMLDHVYSEHHSDEICDYCIAAPSIDNALSNSIQTHFSINTSQQHVVLVQTFHSSTPLRFYAARAPPRIS